jgi:hypothetical protein
VLSRLKTHTRSPPYIASPFVPPHSSGYRPVATHRLNDEYSQARASLTSPGGAQACDVLALACWSTPYVCWLACWSTPYVCWFWFNGPDLRIDLYGRFWAYVTRYGFQDDDGMIRLISLSTRSG